MPNKKIDIDFVVNYIVKSLDRYTAEAIKSESTSDPLSQECIKYLYKRIQGKLQEVGKSLDDVLKNQQHLAEFNKHRRLQAVLKYHQQQNHKKSLYVVSNEIFNNRDQYWNQAKQSAASDDTLQALCFTLILQSVLKEHGYNFQNIKEDNHVKQTFFSSGRLCLALKVYDEIFLKEHSTPKSKGESNLDSYFKNRARALAKNHANEEGLLTKLQLNEFEKDVDELAKQAKKIMITEHPDRNSNPQPGRFALAQELRQLAQKGVLTQYIAALKAYRANNKENEDSEVNFN